jgi:hypothetical protein
MATAIVFCLLNTFHHIHEVVITADGPCDSLLPTTQSLDLMLITVTRRFEETLLGHRQRDKIACAPYDNELVKNTLRQHYLRNVQHR